MNAAFLVATTIIINDIAIVALQSSKNYIAISSQDANLRTYDDADMYCRDHFNTSLATIRSKAEQVEAASLIVDKSDAWIGYNKVDSEETFKWMDGSPSPNFKNFAIGEPNTNIDGDDCVFMAKDQGGEWKSAQCSTPMAFLCNSSVVHTFVYFH